MPVLTSSIINNAEIKDKIYYIWDDMVKGFALKVIPNGQKKYVIKYRTSMGGRNAVQRWYFFIDIFEKRISISVINYHYVKFKNFYYGKNRFYKRGCLFIRIVY